MRALIAAGIAVLAFGGAVSAQEEQVPAPVTAAVDSLLRGTPADSIRPSAVPGLYEIIVGPHVVYVSADGKHMMRGDIIEVESRANLTEERRRGARAGAVDKIPEADMVVFGPDDAEHTVTVFTDVECGYCRKLHSEMADYNAAGIRVRYLAFPRAGVNSRVYDKMVSVWCADDRQAAMTAAKQGGSVDDRKCENPVSREYQLGRVLGISGTPTIILENGDMVPGYVPAAELERILDNPDAG